MSGQGRSWLVWAQSLEGLSPTQSLVVGELARLADWRGEAVVSVSRLVAVTGRSRSGVLEALRRLEARGVVRRCRRREGGHQAASRIVLVPGAGPGCRAAEAGDGGLLVRGSRPMPVVDAEGPVVGPDDNEGLRQAVAAALAEGWVGAGAELVARSLVQAAEHQLREVVRAGVVFSGMGWRESAADTVSRAWEVLRSGGRRVVEAERPWAMLTGMVRTAVLERDAALPGGVVVEAVDPALVPEGAGLPGEVERVRVVGVDDLGSTLGRVVAALREAGMEESVAWAGTRRVAELALRGESRRHTLAGDDPRLADLGASPECARAWMTLLVGSRRGTRAPVTGLSGEELACRARAVAAAWAAGDQDL